MARGVPRPVNDRLHDALTMRSVDLVRLANGEAVALTTGIMRQTDDVIAGRLALIEGSLTRTQLKRLEERLTNVLAVQERRMRKRLNAYVGAVAADDLEMLGGALGRIFKPLGIEPKTAATGAAVQRARSATVRGVPMSRVFQRFFRNDRERILAGVRSGLSSGLSGPALARSVIGTRSRRFLDGIRQVSRRSIDTITQTITTHVTAQARELLYEVNPDLVREERWVSTLDNRTSEICQALDGRVFPVGEGIMPPAHPNCLPGNARVAAEGIAASSERWYDGDIVVVDTAGGKQLSCTPNHPILAPTGWVEARFLHEGSDIICSRGDQWKSALVNCDGQDVPSRIEDVAKTLGGTRCMATIPVPTTAEDFHGDGMDAQVAVVRANSLLGYDLQSALDEHVAEVFLDWVEVADLLDAKGSIDQLLVGGFGPTPGIMGLRYLAIALFGAHLRPLEELGFAPGTQLYSVPVQEPFYGVAGYAVPDTETLWRVAGEVFTDQITGVRRVPFRGQVYNLQTDSGFFVANGVPTHNCRSARMPIVPGLRALPVDPEKQTILPATVKNSFDGKGPQVLTYDKWLRSQPAAVQADVLGPTRLALFKTGEIELRGFVNDRGVGRTIDELRARHSKIFDMAGL